MANAGICDRSKTIENWNFTKITYFNAIIALLNSDKHKVS